MFRAWLHVVAANPFETARYGRMLFIGELEPSSFADARTSSGVLQAFNISFKDFSKYSGSFATMRFIQ